MSERIVKFHHDERGIVKTWDEVGELIRCKDCKHYARNKNIFHRGSDCLKGNIGTIVPDRDFCSRAERKEE